MLLLYRIRTPVAGLGTLAVKGSRSPNLTPEVGTARISRLAAARQW
jgi:hypothetical protein